MRRAYFKVGPLAGQCKITYSFGFSALPTALRDTLIRQTMKLYVPSTNWDLYIFDFLREGDAKSLNDIIKTSITKNVMKCSDITSPTI